MKPPFPPNDDPYTIHGLAIPFGGKDLDGEFFDSSTDLFPEWFPNEGRPFLYHHGLDAGVGTFPVGRQTKSLTTEDGVWVEIQLYKRSKYVERIRALLARGALGLSTGAMSHLARVLKESGRILSWPWVEVSATPTPSHAGAVVYSIKAASEAITHLDAVGTAIPMALREMHHVDATQVDLRAIAHQADVGSAPARKRTADAIRDVRASLARADAIRQAELRAIAAKADDPEIAALARVRHAERERQRVVDQRRRDERTRDWRMVR